MTLRAGVRFSDGSPFNTDTAIAALNLYGKGKSDFLQIDQDSFKKISPLSFSFRSEIGSSLIIENMTHRSTSMFSTTADRAVNPVGTAGWFRGAAQKPPDPLCSAVSQPQGAAPFDIMHDKKVREAIAWAIDRETLANVLYAGHGIPAKGILPGWMFNLGDDHTDGFGYDPEKAGALPDEAGWLKGSDGVREKDGRKMTLCLVAAHPNVSTVKPMPEMLEQMFSAIGVDIDLVEVDDSGIYSSTYLKPGEGDLFMEFASNNNTDPTYLLYNLFTTKTPWASYQLTAPGPHVDALLDEARAAQSRDEIISKVRAAHRAIVQDDLAAIPILLVPNFTLSRPGIDPAATHTDR